MFFFFRVDLDINSVGDISADVDDLSADDINVEGSQGLPDEELSEDIESAAALNYLIRKGKRDAYTRVTFTVTVYYTQGIQNKKDPQTFIKKLVAEANEGYRNRCFGFCVFVIHVSFSPAKFPSS